MVCPIEAIILIRDGQFGWDFDLKSSLLCVQLVHRWSMYSGHKNII